MIDRQDLGSHEGTRSEKSEGAVSFAERKGPGGPQYYPTTIPLVDIRAGVAHYEREFLDDPIAELSRNYLEAMRKVFYMDRTRDLCEKTWAEMCPDIPMPLIAQKSMDAVTALRDHLMYEPEALAKPTPEHLSKFFQALYERDRRININGTAIPQGHIDAYVMLHNPEWERIAWDSANQDLALMLCDHLCVTVSIPEIERENIRFQERSGIETLEDFENFLSAKGWSQHE
jgi:hypothetical protein